jgi:hypothetical protein
MRAVIQRVREAAVTVDDHTVARIGAGLLVLCGVAPSDSIAAADWLAHKIVALRIFDDDAGVMNRSVRDLTAPRRRRKSRSPYSTLSSARSSANSGARSRPACSARTCKLR